MYDLKRSISLSWMMHNKRPDKRKLRTPVASAVPRTLRFDNIKHLPTCTSGYTKRKACDHCRKTTNVICRKCKVHLCLSNKRNCYIPYHSDGEGSDSDNADIDSDNVDSGSNHANSDANDADSESNPVFSDSDIDEQQPEENDAANETPEI